MISPSQQIDSEGDGNDCIVVRKGKPKGQNKKEEAEERQVGTEVEKAN